MPGRASNPKLLQLAKLRDNWETIRDEAVRLFDEGFIRAAAKNNDWGFYSFFKSGWKRFYLKWYDDFLPSARTLCPKTVQLLNSIPTLGLLRAEVLSDDRDCWADRGVGVAMMRVGWICNPPS